MTETQKSLRIFAILNLVLGALDIFFAAAQAQTRISMVSFYIAGALAVVFGLVSLWVTKDASKANIAWILGFAMILVELVNIVMNFIQGTGLMDLFSGVIRLIVDVYLVLLLNRIRNEYRE